MSTETPTATLPEQDAPAAAPAPAEAPAPRPEPAPAEQDAAPAPEENPRDPANNPHHPMHKRAVLSRELAERRSQQVRGDGPFANATAEQQEAIGIAPSIAAPAQDAAPAPVAPQGAPAPAPAATPAPKPSGRMARAILDGKEVLIPVEALRMPTRVNGQEIEITGAEAADGYQMRRASDQRFQEAAQKERAIADFLARNPHVMAAAQGQAAPAGQGQPPAAPPRAPGNAQAPGGPATPQVTDEELAQRIAFGDPATDGKEAIQIIRNQIREDLLRQDLPSVARQQAQQVLQAEQIGQAFRQVMAKIEKDYPEVFADDDLRTLADQRLTRLWADDLKQLGYAPADLEAAMRTPDGRATLARTHAAYQAQGKVRQHHVLLREAAKHVASKFGNGARQDGTTPTPAAAPAAGNPDRIAAKRSIPRNPPPASTRQTANQPPPRPDRAERFRRLRAARELRTY